MFMFGGDVIVQCLWVAAHGLDFDLVGDCMVYSFYKNLSSYRAVIWVPEINIMLHTSVCYKETEVLIF